MVDAGQELQHGRYRIAARISQGGMGTVYQASDRNLGDRVIAIKENSDTSPETQQQFQREAAVLARLTHPNLPRVTDYFIEPSGRQYLVMDYVPGDDLRQIVQQRNAPLPEAEALAWIEPVMDALAYMHGWINPETGQPSPIIHRDIKPANIKRTPNGRTVLVDFGLAKYQIGEGTLVGARAVTPGYSPLEQYAGGTDTRSDIYSLGATLYFLLTGVKPPDAPALAARTPLVPPQKLNPRVSRSTERVILRAMQLHAANRYQSIAEMHAALFDTDNFPTVFDRGRSLPQKSPTSVPANRRPRRTPLSLPLLLLLVLVGLISLATITISLRPIWMNNLAYIGSLAQSPSLTTAATAAQDAPGSDESEQLTATPAEQVASPDTPPAPVPTDMPTATPLPAPSPTSTATIPAAQTPLPAPTATPPAAATPLPATDTATATAAPRATATLIATATAAPTATATATPVPTSTATATPAPTSTATATAVPTATATATATPVPTATATAPPTADATATRLPTATSTPQPTSTPAAQANAAQANAAAGSADATRVNATDGAIYVLVPAGAFTMGSANGNPDEQPVHTVTLDSFWIKQTEVTNDEYRRCVDAGACAAPRSEHWNEPAFAAHPVVGVAWEDANRYAAWAGGRLPTEAEWEKAARGVEAIPYPWGEQLPVPELLNYDNAVGDTQPVGFYPAGASPYGALDMAGNVEEWVADAYEDDYYSQSPAENPMGPPSDILRVLRGGSYESGRADVRTTFRGRTLPDARYPSVGFRVVLPAE